MAMAFVFFSLPSTLLSADFLHCGIGYLAKFIMTDC